MQMKHILLTISLIFGATAASAEDRLCHVNGKPIDYFQGYQAEAIMLHGDILFSDRAVDINGNVMPMRKAVFYHVMLTPEKLAAAMIEGGYNLECVSFGLYICNVGDYNGVLYECRTYQE